MDAPRDLHRAVKKAIDAGLSREDALRALTLSPAEIYGVADRLGSIEKGKIANLVLTKGEIFDDQYAHGDGIRGWQEVQAGGGNAGAGRPRPDDRGTGRKTDEKGLDSAGRARWHWRRCAPRPS